MYNYNCVYRIFDKNDHSNIFESDNLNDVLHEFVSILKSANNYNDLFMLKIKDCGSNKKFPFILNTYHYDNTINEIVDENNKVFNIINPIIKKIFYNNSSTNQFNQLTNQSTNNSSTNQSTNNK